MPNTVRTTEPKPRGWKALTWQATPETWLAYIERQRRTTTPQPIVVPDLPLPDTPRTEPADA